MQVDRIDHIVLTVKDIAVTADFYESILGMKLIVFGEGRFALSFGNQKINLHQLDNVFEPHAGRVCAGSADLCFFICSPINQAVNSLIEHGVPVIEGPVNRTGATGVLSSIYFRDPDDNLVEVSNYIDT